MTEKTQPEKPKKLTFDGFDKLDLESFAEDLFQVIDQGLKSPIGEMGEKRGWTISLNAPFGNGKTTFLKMFENYVKTKKEEAEENTDQQKGYEVLFINAWESDFSKEPVIAILAEFVNFLEQNNKQKDNQNEKSKKYVDINLKNIIKVMGTLANQFMQSKTGLNFKEAISDQELGDNLLEEFNQKKSAIEKVKKILSEYNEKTEKKLLIIVDELDRTRPDYAVHFLEDMKHFFDIENVAFLVAVNQTQMKATVKCLFGLDEDFEGYYRKFFKQEMDLPDPYEPYRSEQKLIDNLIKKTTVKYGPLCRGRIYRVENTYLCCKMFKLTLREIENFVRIFEMILGSKNSTVLPPYMDAYSFFICLFLKRNDDFEKILEGDFNENNFMDFLQKDSLLKNFIKKPKSKTLLYNIACSFFSGELDFKTNSKKIEDFFPKDKTIDYSYRPEYDQLAIKACERIKKCQSVFK